jgi:hypothetical protein
MTTARCPSCGHTQGISADLRGRRVACPPCGKRFTVPLPPTPAAWPADRPRPGAGFRRFAAGFALGAAVMLLIVIWIASRPSRRKYEEPPPPVVANEPKRFEFTPEGFARFAALLEQSLWKDLEKDAPVVTARNLRRLFDSRPERARELLQDKTVIVSGHVWEVHLGKAANTGRPGIAIALEVGGEDVAPVSCVFLRFAPPPSGKFPEDFLARVKRLKPGDEVRGVGRLAPLREDRAIVFDAEKLAEQPEEDPGP